MRRMLVALSAVGMMLLGGATFGPSDVREAYAAQADAVLRSTTMGCFACEVCNPSASGHSMSSSGSGTPKDGLLHGCFEDGCSYHPDCWESMIELKSNGGIAGIYSAVAAATGDELPDVVGRLGAKVSFNRERQAVQVEGCNGRIIANIPLTKLQLRALAD